MKVRVQLFAGAREAAGVEFVDVAFPAGSASEHCLAAIAVQHPSLAALAKSSRLAIDDRYLALDEPVPQGRPLALIPPVSGG
ncbi:ThiS family protein [Pirellulimonas nuda]|uniref:Molybdopterin synthase sulfur carrier subunit n=1 Tax=Pirellulimonas nuda TaxID=2528009 RepID=A0A518DF80_9BACT|nr:MoaD/ThiS family protein [Pirellulimonas nuda]QDU90137.1 ThiS family protein [Pirellulimonas nuda]